MMNGRKKVIKLEKNIKKVTVNIQTLIKNIGSRINSLQQNK